MANHRMFSNRVANSARFLQMPAEAQLLYFHMVLRADDDGVVESYPLVRILGLPPDVFKILLAKEFIKQINEDQVVVVMDWLEHNKIRADRKVNSIYKPLLDSIGIDTISPKPRSDVEDNTKRIGGQSTDGISKDKLSQVKLSKVNIISKDIRAKAQPREDINILISKLVSLLGVLDDSKQDQRRSAKNFLDSKTPEILRQSGNLAPTKEQVINATLRVFQIASQDDFHKKNCRSMKYVYNKAASIVTSVKNNKPRVSIIS